MTKQLLKYIIIIEVNIKKGDKTMLNIKNADVVGTREFTSKENKQYKIIYFLLENEIGVKGMATGQCFVSSMMIPRSADILIRLTSPSHLYRLINIYFNIR